jgi:tRNA(Ile2) C34 agmatinyltransferase TiaS
VLFEDWRDKVSDEQVFCPICRFDTTADSWNAPEQSEYIRAVMLNHVQGVINTAMKEDARRFNRSQKLGFISLSLSVKPGRPQIEVPVSVADIMRQTFICEACGCRYASVGLAYFCPSCGHNSVLITFEKTVNHYLR